MINSKRAFLTTGIAVASAHLLSGCGGAQAASAPVDVSAKAGALVRTLGINYPILMANMGGFSSMVSLVAAVSEAGGLGGLQASFLSEADLRTQIAAVRAATSKPFAVGYITQFLPASTLQVALDLGVPIVQFAFGIPTAPQVASIRAAGAKFGVQLSSVEGAREALALGVDYIVLQGQEAGGHVQAQNLWHDTLPDVLALAGSTPVVVAGGLSTGQDLLAAMRLGAAGGLFGTRFIATQESPAHPDYKAALVAAGRKDRSLTVCFDGNWSYTLHGVLRNNTLKNWEAAGAKMPGSRPNEGELVFNTTQRYSAQPPSAGATGTPAEAALYAGQGIEEIRDIPRASDLVLRIWNEATSA